MLTISTLNRVEAWINAHATYEAPLSPLSIASKLGIPMTDVAAALRDLAADKVLNVRSMDGQPCYFPRRQALPVQDEVPKPEDYAKADEDPDEEKGSKTDSKKEEDDEEGAEDPGCRHCGKVLPTPGRTRQHEVVCGKNPDRPKPKVSEKKVKPGPTSKGTVPKERAERIPHSTYFDDVRRMYGENRTYDEMASELGTTRNVVDNVIEKMFGRGLLQRRDDRGVQTSAEEKEARALRVIALRGKGLNNVQIAKELGVSTSCAEKVAGEMMAQGRLDPAPGRHVPTYSKNAAPARRSEQAQAGPLAGLGSLVAELQRIPGVKIQVTISIGLGVGQ